MTTRSSPRSDGTARRRDLSAAERFLLAACVSALVAASAVPYVVAWRTTPCDRVYVGTTEASIDDYPTYLARMRLGAKGTWTYASPYAPGLRESLIIRPFYTAIGALTAAAGAPLWVGYHTARLVLGALCLIVLFSVVRSISLSPAERWAGFFLACVGSGFGWMLGRQGPRHAWSYDLWVPELNVAYSLLTNPHFPLATALMLGILACAARSLESGLTRYAALAGLLLGCLAIEHTYDVCIVAGALATFGVAAGVRGSAAGRTLFSTGLVMILAASPAFVWQLASFASDPSLAHMALSQPVGFPWMVVSGVGLLAPLSLLGAPELARRSTLGKILVGWCVVVPLLLLVPWPFPRRMVAGWHVPLGIAAGLALARLVERLCQRRLRYMVLALVVAVSSLSTLDVLTFQIRRFSSPDGGMLRGLPRELLDAYDWLQKNAEPGSIVLAPYPPSNWLPVFTDLAPYFGQWAETPDGSARWARVRWFYRRRTTGTERAAFLRQAGIRWVLSWPTHRFLWFERIDAEQTPGLSLVHRAGEVEISRFDGGATR